MMTDMKHRLLPFLFTLITLLAPVVAMAADDEDSTGWEARLEGYATTVRLPQSGTALTWFATIFLAAMAIAALLKNAKRTHLD
jgi:hypothetical protein